MPKPRPQVSIRQDDDHVWATPLPKTMVPDAYGAIWCNPEGGTYWADPHACATLDIAERGSMSDDCIADLLAHVTPEADGPQRYYTFHNHVGHVVRARLVPANGNQLVILVDDLEFITTRVFELKASEREARELFEHAPYGIYRATVDGRLRHANPSLVRLNGYDTEAEMLGAMNDVVLQAYVDPRRRQAFLDELHRQGRVVDFISEIYRHKTNERIWISQTAWLVHDDSGVPRYMAGTLVDVTERVKHMAVVKAAAETDALTGLANRASFYAELDRRIFGQASNGVTLFLLDCDRFKDINDVYGHARGDMVLRVCADRLRQAAPGDATLARLGGDEFAVLTSSVIDREGALDLARHIARVFEAPIEIDGATHQVGASIGIARFPDHALTTQDLMRNADLALYAVKDTGRGNARLFDEELNREKQARLSLERDLGGAHRRGELELHYQPVVDARTSATVGVEALIRWRSPTRGLVNPAEFISVAEDSGLMLAFGKWTIQEACRHAAALPDHIKVAVNISALQVRSSDLPEVTATALADNGVDPSRLELEVTESMVLKNEAAAFEVLEKLRAIGVSLALDDFGTGYSTLCYLQRFPFDKIKIDQAFVNSIKTNAVNRAVTRALLSIGRDLGIAVVAEGIETAAERETLLNEGCIFQQGYYYGRPQPFVDIATTISLESLGRPSEDRTEPEVGSARRAC